jgi:hypothetical protein
MPGPPGVAGAAGVQGPPGAVGAGGEDGEDGIALPGPPGVAGTAGVAGPPGANGTDGEDADAVPFVPPSQIDVGMITGPSYLTGSISPAQLTGAVNNYSPPGISGASILRQDVDGTGRNITGLNADPNVDGRVITILNIGTAGSVNLVDESGSSTNTNRFALANKAGSDLKILSEEGVIVIYDGTSQRWRVIGRSTPVAQVISQDLGTGASSGNFQVTGLSGLIANKMVFAQQIPTIISSKGNARDEQEMDMILLSGVCDTSTTSITFYWWAPSIVVGTYNFAYWIAS